MIYNLLKLIVLAAGEAETVKREGVHFEIQIRKFVKHRGYLQV